MIEVWDAEDLAGILIGLEDAKKDLLTAFRSRQEGDPTSNHEPLIDAAERWDALSEKLSEWPKQLISDTSSQNSDT